MAMTVAIDMLTAAAPTVTAVTAVKWNQIDTASGTTPIPTPTATGTNFSFVKTFQVEITATGGLAMTNVKVGKVAGETTTGTKLWHFITHAVGVYVQATAAPTSTGDNNSTAPTINGGTATAMPLIGAPPAAYSAGPFSATGRVGTLIEISLGVDFSNATANPAAATPTLRWAWTES